MRVAERLFPTILTQAISQIQLRKEEGAGGRETRKRRLGGVFPKAECEAEASRYSFRCEAVTVGPTP